MKKILFTALAFFFYLNVNSQTLGVNETLEYIEKLHSEYNYHKTTRRLNNETNEWYYLTQEYKYSINEKGFLIQQNFINEVASYKTSVYIRDLNPNISFSKTDYSSNIEIKCKYENCISYRYQQNQNELFRDEIKLVITQEYQARKLMNAFNYLFSLVENTEYERDKNDPFSVIEEANEEEKIKIKLYERNGTYQVVVNIENIYNQFILDTGASETTISSILERELIKNGKITKGDYIADGLYRIADGSIISQKRLIIKNLNVGGVTINNLIVSVGNTKSPLLLGKNFLDRFNNWTIDNTNNTLRINN